MKLTDYVAEYLAQQGIKQVFGLTGGAVVHLFDSLAKQLGIEPIFTHHEQAAALAAEAYARIRNDVGAAVVTTGPGGTNAITGVLAAWMDSVPCIYISGQARVEHTSRGKPIRQLGTQEMDIVSLVSHITKYAVMIDDPRTIRYHLEKAVHLARSGRPGPVWIDIPLNIQWLSIEPDKLPGYQPESGQENQIDNNQLDKCLALLKNAKRPLVLAGYGIRLGKAVAEFRRFINDFNIPFVSSWNASDLLPTDSKLYAGRVGMAGQRGGNLAIQNCDCLLALGSHLSLQLTGMNQKTFAREAKKIMVNIDPVEAAFRQDKVDLSLVGDVKSFLSKVTQKLASGKMADTSGWRKQCAKYKKYNAVQKEWKRQAKYVNPYVFVDTLSDALTKDDVIAVDGGGTALYMSFQASIIKKDQRLIVSAGIAAMGTGLPESIGACFANGRKRTICLTGDGSLQLNIHELQTVMNYGLPVKIFVFNNSGYLAIRHTQNDFLDSKYVGSSQSGGVGLPDYQKVAKAYGLKTSRIGHNRELKGKIDQALKLKGPVLCEIMIDPDQQLIPRVGFDKNPDGTGIGRPLEDMFPYLSDKEYASNMLVKPLRKIKD